MILINLHDPMQRETWLDRVGCVVGLLLISLFSIDHSTSKQFTAAAPMFALTLDPNFNDHVSSSN